MLSNDSIFPIICKGNVTDNPSGGLTKRELFAAMAMQGLMSKETIDGTAQWEQGRAEKIAAKAVQISYHMCLELGISTNDWS